MNGKGMWKNDSVSAAVFGLFQEGASLKLVPALPTKTSPASLPAKGRSQLALEACIMCSVMLEGIGGDRMHNQEIYYIMRCAD